jgi:hypothetical protein
MVDESVKAGVLVRLPDTHQSGTVREVDHSLLVARVALITGAEMWVRLDDLKANEVWDTGRMDIGEET